MRDLVLDTIENLRKQDGFRSGLMRWSHFYWSHYGTQYMSRKEAKRAGFKHLGDTTRDDLEQMTDENLLNLFQFLIRQCSKQF